MEPSKYQTEPFRVRATLKPRYAGVEFYLRAEDQRTLPVILTQQEVIRILSEVTTFHNYVFFSLVYACGLRLGKALALTVDDIYAQAMLLHVRTGNGG